MLWKFKQVNVIIKFSHGRGKWKIVTTGLYNMEMLVGCRLDTVYIFITTWKGIARWISCLSK